MSLCRLSLIAFGLLILAAAVHAVGTVAVAFVDVKFDDKAAIWSLLLNDEYSKVIAITSGIDAHGKAAYELEQYLQRQNTLAQQKNYKRFRPDKITIFRGDNVLPEPPSHQEWWKDNPNRLKPEANSKNLRHELHDNRVRIFQIAPTSRQQVLDVISATDVGSIESYMLLHGYNSMQANMVEQTSFLRDLKRMISNRSPSARVIFTSSFQSYPGKNGGKQLLTDIRPLFPEQDIQQALRDPFWSRQILKAHKGGLAHKPYKITNPEELDGLIYRIRLDPEKYRNEREHLVNYIQNEVLAQRPANSRNKVYGRLEHTLIPEFTGETTIELADANHIAAFHRYLRDGTHSGMYEEEVHYPAGPHPEGAAVEFRPASRGQEVHGNLLRKADPAEDLHWIKTLARAVR